jgi:Ca2+/H+ antiporter
MVELGALGGSVLFVAAILFHGRSSRGRGWLLLAAYAVVVAAFLAAGER